MPKHFGQLAALLFFLAALVCFLTAAAGPAEERAARMIIGGVVMGLAGIILFIDASVGAVEQSKPKVAPKHEGEKRRSQRPEIDLHVAIEKKVQQ